MIVRTEFGENHSGKGKIRKYWKIRTSAAVKCRFVVQQPHQFKTAHGKNTPFRKALACPIDFK